MGFFVSIQFGEFVELFSTLVESKKRHFRKFGEYLIERVFSLLGTYFSYRMQPLDAALIERFFSLLGTYFSYKMQPLDAALIERVFSLLGTYFSYRMQPLDAAQPRQTIPLRKFSGTKRSLDSDSEKLSIREISNE